MREYHLNEIVRLPRTLDSVAKKVDKTTTSWGRIIYIHPENRFATVQFEHSRESYPVYEIEALDTAGEDPAEAAEAAEFLPF